jgi:hypothetical protein
LQELITILLKHHVIIWLVRGVVGAIEHKHKHIVLVQDAEIARLREELGAARAKLSSWEESMIQVQHTYLLLILLCPFAY